MTPIQKWKLISSEDLSVNSWFPMEKRVYELPDGKIIDDFMVTTLADTGMVIPITKTGNVVMVRQYKPGIDEITLEFPAGRMEKFHTNPEDTARHELEEETGIVAAQLFPVCVMSGFTTKASEKVYCYIATDVEISKKQKIDVNEHIEVVQLRPTELDTRIDNGEVISALAVAGWFLSKRKFPKFFEKV